MLFAPLHLSSFSSFQKYARCVERAHNIFPQLKVVLGKDLVALFFNLNLECNRALLECKQMSFSRSLATKKFTQCSKIFWCFLALKLKSKFQECTKPVVAQDVSLAIHLAYEGWLQVISAVLVSHQVQTYGILQCKY